MNTARTPAVGTVLGGLVLVALAVAVGAHEVLDRSWDWTWYAAGVLVLAGLAVVTAALVAAIAGSRTAPRDEDGESR